MIFKLKKLTFLLIRREELYKTNSDAFPHYLPLVLLTCD